LFGGFVGSGSVVTDEDVEDESDDEDEEFVTTDDV
jgi:hypothetical protein